MSSRKHSQALAPRERPDNRALTGSFDIIGDVHGCADELVTLLADLGYDVDVSGRGDRRQARIVAPKGRRAVFVGDLVDRGPSSPDVLRIVMAFAQTGQGFAVPGNHDVKLVRWLEGRHVKLSHGLEATVDQLQGSSAGFRKSVLDFLSPLPIYLWLDGGRLVVVHAGLREDMIGRDSGEIRSFALFGDTSGETDENGLPVRYHWAAAYQGAAAIVYGHTPVPQADWVNNTLCIDTGCCFGGRLTALRWPEREIISVPARAVYAPTRRPFGHPPVRPGVEIATR